MQLVNSEELRILLKKVVWDYNIDEETLVKIFYKQENSSSMTSDVLYTKLLNGYNWHYLIKVLGIDNALTLLDEKIINRVFPRTYRKSLSNARRILYS